MTLLHNALLLLSMPLALDGEAAGSDNSALAIIALISIVFGYVLLACLWHFVFRDKARTRRGKDSSD
jgi:hypothetical protein